jgi:hypothetical protein
VRDATVGDIPSPLYAYALCAASRRMDGDGAHIGDSPEQSPEQSPEGENKKQNVRKALYRGTVTKGIFTSSHFHTAKNDS